MKFKAKQKKQINKSVWERDREGHRKVSLDMSTARQARSDDILISAQKSELERYNRVLLITSLYSLVVSF